MGQRVSAGRRSSIVQDIVRGAFLGDYAPELGLPGALTQVVLSFVPVVGTLCALRDARADQVRRDRPGVILNLLATFPLLGGVAKTAEVLRHAQRLKRGFDVTARQYRTSPKNT